MRKLFVLFGMALLVAEGGYLVAIHYDKSLKPALARAVQTALDKNGFKGLTVEIDGRYAQLSGEIPSTQAQHKALRIVRDIPGVRDAVPAGLKVVDHGPVEPRVVQPAKRLLDITAVWDGTTLTMQGEVSGRAFKGEIYEVVDKHFDEPDLQDARFALIEGEPPPQAERKMVLHALEVLAQTRGGTFTMRLGQPKVTLEAVVVGAGRHNTLVRSLRAHAAPGYALDLARFVRGAEQPSADAVSTTDTDAPDTAADTAIDAGDTAPADTTPPLDTTVTIDAGPEDTGPTAVPDTRPAAVADTAPAKPDDTRAAVDTAAPSFDFQGTSPLGAQGCQDLLHHLVLGEERILFKGPAIAPESMAKVETAYRILQRCPDEKIIVQGFYDSYGEPDQLRALTRRRAFIVRNKLIELGMDKDRVAYMGYGYNRPRYPDRRATRHLNRRIEFQVKGVKKP